jgi:chemotaxis methyl-accepting protein methylase
VASVEPAAEGAIVEIASIVKRETGVAIKESQYPALAASLRRVAPGLGAEGFLSELGGSAPRVSLLAHLIDEVTVQETYFFRELRELEAIDWGLLLDAARESGAGVVRVWVAACATGEEAYSLAILASEAMGGERPPVTILATDVSGGALARAADGDGYSERSVRNLSPELRERYLSRDGGHYAVRPRLRALVRFRHHNLISDPSPPLGEVPFDIVACRNVLIYFDQPTAQDVTRSLEGAVRPGGRLILGAADRLTGAPEAARPTEAGAPERRRAPKRRLRRPLGLPPEPGAPAAAVAPIAAGGPRRRADDRIDEALAAADDGDLERALALVETLTAEDVLMPEAHFVRGLVELERGEAGAAVTSLRRCLYIDPSFGLAAFQLGRAQESLGDERAARRAYEQALRTLDPEDDRHRAILDQVDLGDVAAACAARLRAVDSR